MIVNKSDKVDVISKHMDNKINVMIRNGKDLDGIINELETLKGKYDIILKNSPSVDIRYKYLYTHNVVADKFISDMQYAKTLMYNYSEFYKYSIYKIFRLISLRNKIIGKRIVVELPTEVCK